MSVPTPSATEERRLNNFDFLRFTLAAVVVYCHSYVIISGGTDNEPLCIASHGQMSWGTLAVDFFFVISGFLITQSWIHSKGIWDYFKKRILRIYPAFIVVMLICLLVVGPQSVADKAGWYHHISKKHVLEHLAILVEVPNPGAFKQLPVPWTIDASVWTIRYEFECYTLVALLGLVGLYKRRLLPLLLFLGIFALQAVLDVRHHLHLSHDALYGWKDVPVIGYVDFLPRFLTFFLSGMVFYLYRDKIPLSPWLALGSAAVVVASTLGPQEMDFTLPFFGSYALMSIAFAPWMRLHNWAKRGDLSYGLYLTAWPIQQLLRLYLGPSLQPLALFAMALPLSCIAAALSWQFVEKPFLKFKSKSPVRLPTPVEVPVAASV